MIWKAALITYAQIYSLIEFKVLCSSCLQVNNFVNAQCMQFTSEYICFSSNIDKEKVPTIIAKLKTNTLQAHGPPILGFV